MQFKEALTLLSPAIPAGNDPRTWSDLGCGSGLFTRSLLKLLADGSRIYAVDKRDNLETAAPEIAFVQADFVTDQLPFQTAELDGVMMANSLHYVKDKEALIRKLRLVMKPDASWVIIEYETSRSNPWVPFPIMFDNLKELFLKAGYSNVEKLSEKPSIYQGLMYCARIS